MDRLIIESILADVNEVFLSGDNNGTESSSVVVLGFKAINVEQVIHAFTELKKMEENHEISLVICETMVSGMYDLEILTDALDEPIRICNKVIDHELLNRIGNQIRENGKFLLAVHVSQEESQIKLRNVQIREC